jgi:hypothetical protein
VVEAGDKLSAAYTRLLPQLSLTVDQQLAQEMVAAARQAAIMSPDLQRRYINIVQDEIARRTGGGNTLTGEQYKEIVSALGTKAREWVASSTATERELGKALFAVQDAFKSWLYRSNPNHADALKAIDTGYAMLVRIEGAAGKTAAANNEMAGLFTPFQLLQSIRASDPSLRHRAFARGDALLQDWGQAGASVLGNRVPNSGTADRALLATLGLGGGSYMLNNPFIPAGVATATLPYLPGGRQATAALLAGGRGPTAKTVSGILDLAHVPIGAQQGPTLFPGLVP